VGLRDIEGRLREIWDRPGWNPGLREACFVKLFSRFPVGLAQRCEADIVNEHIVKSIKAFNTILSTGGRRDKVNQKAINGNISSATYDNPLPKKTVAAALGVWRQCKSMRFRTLCRSAKGVEEGEEEEIVGWHEFARKRLHITGNGAVLGDLETGTWM
jgi:hypothetical protein